MGLMWSIIKFDQTCDIPQPTQNNNFAIDIAIQHVIKVAIPDA